MDNPEAQRKETIRRILDLEKTEQSMTDDSVRSGYGDLYQQACQHFGTWLVALEYAGVSLKRGTSQNFTPESVVKRIRRRCSNLHSMKAMFVRKADYRLYRDAKTTFGTWQRSLEHAGVDKDKLYFGPTNPKVTCETILVMLIEWLGEGQALTPTAIACRNQAFARALVFRYGGFQNAFRLAELAIKSDRHVGQILEPSATG